MIIRWTGDGRTFVGSTDQELVDRMRDAGLFTAAKTPVEYMRGVARRVRIHTGDWIATCSYADFLKTLEQAGLISREPLN